MFALGSAPPPSRPRTPVPKFKYLDNPKTYGRSYAHRQTPFEGDFCVVSIDHVASVADLGPEAMEAAKRIPSGLYVAYIGMSLSLPFEGHPTNPFTIAPISQGIPSESTLCDDTPACIPILPNAECFGERQPLEAVAPFPWPDCYVSTFTARSCRVTNTKRDYSHVLCVPIDLVNARANRWIFKDRSFLNDFEERREQGDPEALARKARSLSPAESSADPLYFLPPLPSVSRPDAATTTGLDTPGAEAVIEDSSTAGNFSGTPAFNPAEFPPESALYGALASAVFNTGRPDQPIVNIWYDLDMVSGVRDPHLFASEYDMLEQLRMYYHPERVAERGQAQADAERRLATKPAAAPDAAPSPTSTATTTAREKVSMPHTTSTDTSEASSHPSPTSVPDVSFKEASTKSSPEAVARPPSPTRLSDERRSSTQQDKVQRPASRRFFVALAAKATSSASALGNSEPAQQSRSASSRGVHRSTSRTSLRSVISASSASPTKREFPKHPHPYERSTRSSASTISYTVPRPRHDSLKSLRKSRSSSSLKAPRHSTVTLPARSLK